MTHQYKPGPEMMRCGEAISELDADEMAAAQSGVATLQGQAQALVEAVQKYFSLEAEPYSRKRPPTVIHHEQDIAMSEMRNACRALPDPLPTVKSVERAYLEQLIADFAEKSRAIDQSDANGRALALSYVNAVQCLRSLLEGGE